MLKWADVSREKHRLDWEQQMRAYFIGFKRPLFETIEQIDEQVDKLACVGTLEFDCGLSFYHSVETVVAFCENVGFSRDEAAVFLSELFDGNAIYNPLYIREMLNYPERLGFERNSLDVKNFALEVNRNYGDHGGYKDSGSPENVVKVPTLEGESDLASEFFAQRQKEGTFPKKLIVHSVDTQASRKAWRTYEQVARQTSTKLASVATYGLVPGGVLGGINPTTLFGTLDRADLCIINWYPQYQGAVLFPVERFVKDGFGCRFTGSRSVMIDGDRGGGTDIIVGQNEEGILPYMSPSDLIIVIPQELQRAVADEMIRLHRLLRRPRGELTKTLEMLVGYNPSLWKNFHYFNEWLQTTPGGNALLEERIGCPVSKLKSSDEIKANIKEGRFRRSN